MSRVRLRAPARLVLQAGLWLAAAGPAMAAFPAFASSSEDPADSTAADRAPGRSDAPRKGFLSKSECFPGVPGPNCPGFMLSEVTLGKQLHQEQGLVDNYLTLELGYLKSHGPRTALGLSGSLTWSEDHRYGIHGHVRQWLNPHFSVDLSPGVWASGESMFDNRWNRLGVSARAALMWEETFGIGVEMDSGNPVGQKAGTEWKTAFRAGGYASFAAVGVFGAILLMYAIALHSPNY